MSLLTQVLAFEQIIKRAKDKRSAEMQILIGGIGVAIIPLAIAQHYTKSNPFGFENSSFEVTKITFGDYWITNVAAHDDRRSPPCSASRRRGGCAGPGRASRSGPSASTPRSPRSWASTAASSRWRPWRSPEPWPDSPASCSRTRLGAITPESGDTLLVKAFACIILGGVGSTAGCAFGSFLLAAAETCGPHPDQRALGRRGLVRPDLPGAPRPARPAIFGRKEVRRT